jgi:hypothetical protein
MAYDYTKEPSRDNVPPDVQKIWDKWTKKDVFVAKPTPLLDVTPTPTFHFPVKQDPPFIPTTYPPDPILLPQKVDPLPHQESWLEAHYPKDVSLGWYIFLSIAGCLIGAVWGHNHGESAILNGIFGTAVGFFAIPLVAIGWAIAWRLAVLAVILYVAYLVLVHTMK